MFESYTNVSRNFGLAAIASCTANQAVADNMVSEWGRLWDEAGNYPALSKAVKDELWKAFQAADAWYANAFGSGGVWCARKEDLVAQQATLERAKGALSAAIQGLVRVEPGPSKPGGGVVTLPEERITGFGDWWGLTLGVLALSAVVVARRRRGVSFSGVRSFRRKYGRGFDGLGGGTQGKGHRGKYYVHTRAGGFWKWVAVDRASTKAEALRRIPELQAQDDPMWAEAEYLVSTSRHPREDETPTSGGR